MYSERGINDNSKGDAAGFGSHGNQCPGRDRLYHRGDLPSGSRGASRLDSNGGVVAIGDVRGGAHNSASFVYIGGNLQTSDVCVADPWHARGRQPIAGCRYRSVSTLSAAIRWSALFRRPPILRGVSASQIHADHAANRALINARYGPALPSSPQLRGEAATN